MRAMFVLAFGMVLTATAVSGHDRPRGGQAPDAVDADALVDAYAAGRDDIIAAALRQPRALQSLGQALLQVEFTRDDRRRRTQAAALAAEAAELRGLAEPPAALSLIRWACELLRQDEEPDAAERAFHRAAVALLEGLGADVLLEVHAEHALHRFSSDPYLELARGVARELLTFPIRSGVGRLGRNDDRFSALVNRLDRAAGFPEVRAEALTRLGLVHLRNSNPDRALIQLEQVPELTDDRWVLYLAHLFRGRALETQRRDAEAVEAFRAAVGAVPAQSALFALSAALLRLNAREEASNLAWAATALPEVADPWVSYGRGDMRRWSELRTGLREAVR